MRQPRAARYTARRILRAIFFVVMIAAVASFGFFQTSLVWAVVAFAIGLSGFVGASEIPVR